MHISQLLSSLYKKYKKILNLIGLNRSNLLRHFTLNKVFFWLFMVFITTFFRYSGICPFIIGLMGLEAQEYLCWGLSGLLCLLVRLPFIGVFEAINFPSLNFSFVKFPFVKFPSINWNILNINYLRYQLMGIWLGAVKPPVIN